MSDQDPQHLPPQLPGNPTPQYDTVDLIDILGVLYRYKFLIIGLTGFAAVAVVIFAIISIVLPPDRSPLPNVYEPEAIILIDDGQSGSGGLQAALAARGLSGFPGLPSVGGGSYGELAVLLLRSNTLLDRLVDEFNIVERYDIDRFQKDDARKALRDRSTVTHRPETRTLHIRYEDIDPVFATDMVNRMVELLDQRFSTIGGNREARKRDLLQDKLIEIERDIAVLESEVKDFQRQYGTINPESYAREQVTMLAELRSRLIGTEIEARTYGEFATIHDPVAARLRAEAEQLRATIHEMEHRFFGGPREGGSNQAQIAGAREDIPELSIRFARLERELRVQARIYETLTEQYEVARLSAEDESLAFQILEMADVPERKSGPSRAVLCMVVTTATFFGSIFLVFLLNMVRNLKADPETMKRLRGRV
ncbi:Uncharacterized protein involved in exopolysaccharide biosynthesis [Alkalispirochaeta americana]|uniref:Uncharacterized protein involved in exopolysaccharide biosynthesis n=1 Tax=Alkalispirochaeta americana TaxID=159291 RepID=A0A1N6XJP8_9SPIO|nr:hypothetical protein [Alkalispirochaeta americana]SIR02564.1 Uncharacterized protein involved in exopolysaccharide biosynthesis [Alkalispirochaeta americana]